MAIAFVALMPAGIGLVMAGLALHKPGPRR